VAPGRLAVATVVAVLAGCGGDGDASAPADCSDRAFRAQDEELYVAQATVQNALAVPGAAASQQLRQGARVLRRYVDAHPPCSDELRDAADLEGDALDAIDDAARSPGSADARAALERALGDLREAGRRIRPEAIPETG
jgi:hypothetical protein